MNDKSKSQIIGAAAAVLFHCALLFVFFKAGLKYIYPPPAEQASLIEFDFEEVVPIEVTSGTEPRSENPDTEREIELVQRSKASFTGQNLNVAEEASIGETGDVEIPEPERKEINKRALFTSANNKQNKDTLAAQTAGEVSDELAAGHPLGNTETGNTDGEPSARLEGRSVMGSLPKPSYTVQKAGRVVVQITVDRKGNVTSAIPGAQGTTVTDHTLWEEAKSAALNAHFNISDTAPELQEGTITYVFKLR